jgi:hypothetical protein
MRRAWGLTALVVVFGATPALAQRRQPTPNTTGVSPEEQAVLQFNQTRDPGMKLQQAREFALHYPASKFRAEVVRQAALTISGIPDNGQKISFAEKYLLFFQEPPSADYVMPALIDGYVRAKRMDEAFERAAAYLLRNPDDLPSLTLLALAGMDQIKANQMKFSAQTETYGAHAVELIEAGRRPEGVTDAEWAIYTTKWLPRLCQGTAVLEGLAGKTAAAGALIEKAIALEPHDPFNYIVQGQIFNDEYTALAEKLRRMPTGKERDDTMKQALAQMDRVIEVYAHALGLAEGKPAFQEGRDKLMGDLESYYKYRHGGSAAGLQQLIDKYKQP